ncbi:MAG: hypothetical protein HWE27_05635 [Gammaproteobacteria bacterium]|nr:hypothetical protein [Gammaproteobacteria bacterium]
MKYVPIVFSALFFLGCSTTYDPVEEQKEKAELVERCKKLKQDIDDLKGQPQRRSAAIEYFDEQCFVIPEPPRN